MSTHRIIKAVSLEERMIPMHILTNRMALFPLLVLLKVLFVRTQLFPQSHQFPAVIWELSFLVLFFGLIELASPKKGLAKFLAANFLITTFLISQLMYYNHFGRILDYNAISQIPVLKDLGGSLAVLISLKYFLLYLDIFLLIVYRQFVRVPVNKGLLGKPCSKYSALIVSACALIISAAGLLIYEPIKNLPVFSQKAGIFNVQLYQACKAFQQEEEAPLPANALTKSNIEKVKQLQPVLWPKYFGLAKGKNLILIQMESMENFLIGLSVDGKNITPNLNRLARESIYFPNFYAQVGQGNTADAEFITNTSIYPLSEGAVSANFVNIDFPSLPRLLKEHGYTSVTFHPNTVTFWSRDSLYPSLGIDYYYDKEFYRDQDLVGPWGSSDEVLFQKALPVLLELSKQKKLFYASLITLSCHHPYVIPAEKRLLNLPAQLDGSFLGNYLTACHYQDYALGSFIRDLKASGLWDTSLVVIFGDHFGISKKYETQLDNVFGALMGRKHDSLDALNVPLLISCPGIKPAVINNTGGQVDIFPTVANLLGLSLEDYLIFGQDILNQENNLLGFRYYHPDGTFISNGIFHAAGEESGQMITNHKPVVEKELFAEEEKKINALISLSDKYLLQVKNHKTDMTVEILN